ncbi:MAG: helix-turn-helix transcriptional regulator [Anaerolineales bacterium]|nr:helix-turn-helix transcriptional regulator [Anaerolineales bacterium]
MIQTIREHEVATLRPRAMGASSPAVSNDNSYRIRGIVLYRRFGIVVDPPIRVAPEGRHEVRMPPISQLSGRERDVVAQVLLGKSNKQIAQALGISPRTVEFHLRNIFTKYLVGSRIELILRLGSAPGDSPRVEPGLSPVENASMNPDDKRQPHPSPERASSSALVGARSHPGAAVRSRQTFMIGHAVLWAAAIIATALLGGRSELTTFILPALAIGALYVVGPRAPSTTA